MDATNQIEQYVKEQRQAKLLDVAKHIITAVNSSYRMENYGFKELATITVDLAEALIKEVESR